MTWIWHMCITNMKQRGVRTLLTILGVVIGVISIVSLLAIGIGVKKELLSTVEQTGSVTEIVIYGQTEGKRKDRMLTDRKLTELAQMDHVSEVYPRQTMTTIAQYGHYTGYVQLIALPDVYLQQMKVKKGVIPSTNGRKPELLIGKNVMDLFFNSNTGAGYTDSSEADKDLVKQSLDIALDMEEGAEKHRMTICGITDTMSYDIYCNLGVMQKYLKQNKVDGVIAGQPLDANGEPYVEWIYDSAIIKVEDTSYVDQVVKKLQDKGYQVENNKELLDSLQRELKIVQLMLGGIGMIALIVAVIGISNTMTTSVYDRITEIGILKVLGCDMDELLYLFLLESGILGGIGGLIGIVLSYVLTQFGINYLGVKLLAMPKGTRLAVIPPKLAVGAFFFSVVLGLLAGYFPARWASKLKPMDAMQK
mgnify:FL=1